MDAITAHDLNFDILIPGSYFCDVVFTGLPSLPLLGQELYSTGLDIVLGGTLNSVLALHRLGVRVGWVAALGNDFFSQYVEQQLSTERLATPLLRRLDAPLRRVTVSLSYPADRAFVTYTDGDFDEMALTEDTCARAQFRHLHFPGLEVSERALALIDACHERGATVSMDCQHRDEHIDSPLVREVLSRVDVFLPNVTETQRLTGASDDEAIHTLRRCVRYLVVKAGANGATAYVEGECYHCPALPVTPLDTTGAGDVFNAGFLAAFLSKLSPAECLRWGNFCGGRSTQGLGGLSTAPTRRDLEAWLALPSAHDR
jgi:sugar/nucleoside kinase (ribokinase family)